MDRGWWTRVFVVVSVAIGSVWFLMPTYYSMFVLPRADRNNLTALDKVLPAWAPPGRYKLSLGLDLQGGIYTVMRVDTKTALIKRAERQAAQMVNHIKNQKLGEISATTNPETREVSLTAVDPGTLDAIEKELASQFVDFKKEKREGATLTLSMDEANTEAFTQSAVDQAMFVIRRRIDKWGVAEVDVRKLGADSIQISMPGQEDPEQAKELIGTTAQLEFRLLDNEQPEFFKELFQKSPPELDSGVTLNTASREGFPQIESLDREKLLAYVKDKSPVGRQIMLHCVENLSETSKQKCEKYSTYLVESDIPLTGEHLTDAIHRQNPQDLEIEVGFAFDAAGARDLEALTEKNIGRRMAIVLDDMVHTAPTIQSKIPGGNGRITLGRGKKEEKIKEAQTLAIVLKAGALPAPVTVGEIRQVGASLGDELVKKGSLAALVGLGLVVFFMALYYRVSGLVADVALILNGALILAGLALFKATLTLPGIAGFVLTLGIAVDANVLINERIREELAAGKSARTAVDQGYDRAFWTIFDAHVTTLIAGVILFFTGSGPVQGFATALIVGIVASLFTSIVVTRVITTYLVHGRNADKVSV
jgi:preprotein translocase subunit SecD